MKTHEGLKTKALFHQVSDLFRTLYLVGAGAPVTTLHMSWRSFLSGDRWQCLKAPRWVSTQNLGALPLTFTKLLGNRILISRWCILSVIKLLFHLVFGFLCFLLFWFCFVLFLIGQVNLYIKKSNLLFKKKKIGKWYSARALRKVMTCTLEVVEGDGELEVTVGTWQAATLQAVVLVPNWLWGPVKWKGTLNDSSYHSLNTQLYSQGVVSWLRLGIGSNRRSRNKTNVHCASLDLEGRSCWQMVPFLLGTWFFSLYLHSVSSLINSALYYLVQFTELFLSFS